MRLVNIGVAAVSVKVGDFEGNKRRLLDLIRSAKEEGTHLLVTPELCISGYSLEDRILWRDITRQSWAALAEIAASCDNITALFGLPVVHHAQIFNATALISDRIICGLVLKKYLPAYSVFYEARNWTSWPGGVTEINGVPAGDLVFKLPFGLVTAEICEDLWSPVSPAWERVRAGAEIVCNPSASPFTPRKNETRKRLVMSAAATLKCVYAYANLLGCDNSRLVFDGGGLIASPAGLACEGPLLSKRAWTLSNAVLNLDEIEHSRMENTTWRQYAGTDVQQGQTTMIEAGNGTFTPAPAKRYAAQQPRSYYLPSAHRRKQERDPALDELFDALALGLRDYFEKVGVFKKFLVALSGGRDSALCLLLAVRAAKMLREGRESENYADYVSTLYLPNGSLSSEGTQNAARGLAAELHVPFRVVSIEEEAKVALAKAAEIMGGEEGVAPMTRQNLQARIRGAMMLNWANNTEGLLLVTSNLSEAAVGYSTTGGDNQGGYSPIANVPKTVVTRLLEYLSERDGIRSIRPILDIPPSAELAPGQLDETDLMPYVVLDDLLYLYARKRLSLADCWRLLCLRFPEHDTERLRGWVLDFAKRFAASQWKRDQHPVALKVMDLDLDPKTGFRFPVTQSIQYELDELKRATPLD
ncbi:MAG: Glutamine-dependent NAD(+) synthetase [Candidatus Hydrogenedentes bacterium ADurb.Bin101]|jgi:NAD+ synthase (glutamine-hydrolysing)|nr:MAG: Glutamine-dependent NAD(+) synthetase [Candidatus Hydrogenedentes bacterium ADurb.Bin101]HOC68670.1 NAD(+) synthase [Candidatus Hydrogenedentota bacterium]